MAEDNSYLEEMTLRQLRRVASKYGISRYSRMRKSQLLSAIQNVQPSNPSISPSRTLEAQEEVEAAKFELGQDDLTGGELASVDVGLAELPEGYGSSRIVLLPRDPQWSYCYWDIPNEHKEDLRRQGGQQLALRHQPRVPERHFWRYPVLWLRQVSSWLSRWLPTEGTSVGLWKAVYSIICGLAAP